MKRIQTLGGLAVFEGSRPVGGNAQQPRRLAILAILARAGERGVSRDRLAGLLWGDVEQERARRSLNQALYALRQELGSEEAILGTRELRFNSELIEVDLAASPLSAASRRALRAWGVRSYSPIGRVSPNRASQSRFSSSPRSRQSSTVRRGGSSIGSSVSRKVPQ